MSGHEHDDLMPHEREDGLKKAAALVKAMPNTSETKNDLHDTYCSGCRVWHQHGRACPKCGKRLLLG